MLAETLEPAVRLVLTDALAAMAAELTSRWDGGTVDIRIRGEGPEVVITPAAPAAAQPADASAAARPRRTAPSPGSASGCPSRSSPAPRPRQPTPVSR